MGTGAAYESIESIGAMFNLSAGNMTIESGSVTLGLPHYYTNNITLTVNNGASFTIPAGTALDCGLLNINGTLTVGGALTLAGGTVTINSPILAADGATITVMKGVTVTGSGTNGIATNTSGSDVTYHWNGSIWITGG